MAGKGARAQTIGLSPDGQTTQIHAPTDVLVRPHVLPLTPGNANDVTTAPAVLANAPGRIHRLSAGKGDDANWLRTDLRNSGVWPVIPGNLGRKRRIHYDRLRYCERWRIETMLYRLKDSRSIAGRYDKLVRDFALARALAALVAFGC